MLTTIRYGVVGFSRNQFDKAHARQILDNIYRQIQAEHPEQEIEIVSGYTNSGIPKIAYQLADDYGFTTVGYSARQALKVRSGTYQVDKVILKGKRFGDESEGFVKYIDRLIRVGGGQQSRHEVERFRKMHGGEDNVTLPDILQEHEVEWFGR